MEDKPYGEHCIVWISFPSLGLTPTVSLGVSWVFHSISISWRSKSCFGNRAEYHSPGSFIIPDGDTNQKDWLKNRWNEFTSNKHGDYTNMFLHVFTNFDFFSFPITKSLRTGITVRANIFLCRWSKKHLETGRTCLKLESTNPKFAIVSTYTCPFPRPVDDYNPCLVSLYLPNRYWSYLIL